MQKFLFSSSIYKTWLKRYWVGSLLLLILMIFAVASSGTYNFNNTAYNEPSLLYQFMAGAIFPLLSILIIAASFVAALLCSSYMQQQRASYMIHALPHKRETLLFSITAAGLTLLAIPIVAISLIILVLQLSFYGIVMLKFAYFFIFLLSIAFLFFIATLFVGTFTGNTLIQALLTPVLLNLPLLIELLFLSFCSLYIPGFIQSDYITTKINPFRNIMSYTTGLYAHFYYSLLPLVFLFVGILFFIAGIFIYKKRNIESTGDVVIFPILGIFFKIISSVVILFAGTSVLSIYTGSHSTLYQILISTTLILIGYFGAEMLLQKKVNVFRQCKGVIAIIASYFLIVALLFFDISGYAGYMLDPKDTDFIAVGEIDYNISSIMRSHFEHTNNSILENYDIDFGGNPNNFWNGTDKAMIKRVRLQILQQEPTVLSSKNAETAIALQHFIAENARSITASPAFYSPTTLNFQMLALKSDGSIFERFYTVDFAKSEEFKNLYLEHLQVIELQRLERFQKQLTAKSKIQFEYYDEYAGATQNHTFTKQELEGFLAAYKKDINEKHLKLSLYKGVSFWLNDASKHTHETQLAISSQRKNTIQWLLKNNFITPKQVDYMKINE